MADRSILVRQALALCIGLVSGVIGFGIGMPLPWMLGPMIGTTLAALTALPIRGPDKLRPAVIPVIGVLLGSSITPDIVGRLADWATTLAILPFFLVAAASVSMLVYRRVGGYDLVTAFYAAMPGGLNEMLIVGGEAGGDERRIALAHAARILLVIMAVVFYFGLVLGVRSGAGGSNWVALDALSALDYLLLGLCAIIGAALGKRAGLPAAPVFGPMILSGVLHLTGLVVTQPPSLIVILAQVVMGTVIGGRFVGATFRSVGRDIWLAGLATGGMLCVALLFAEAVAWAVGMPLSQAFLAFSPGGLTEMSLLTLALGQDVAFVSIAHLSRIMVVIAVAPAIFRLLKR